MGIRQKGQIKNHAKLTSYTVIDWNDIDINIDSCDNDEDDEGREARGDEDNLTFRPFLVQLLKEFGRRKS